MPDALWEKLDPGFLEPVWLLVGLFAMLAVLLLEIGAHRRRQQAIRLFAASHLAAELTASVSQLKRLLKAGMMLSATGLLFAALARPHLLIDWREENRTGLDVLLAVDCSKSMLAQDVRPNRLERAKLAISDFADEVPNNRLGLIAFAGDAFLECPLTIDHSAFQDAVRELDTETIPRPGTDIAAAIDLAAESLRSQPNNLKFLILVTDGEDLEGRALSAAKNAAQNGLRIFTVGVGTSQGERIPEQDQTGNMGNHRDVYGQEVLSRLDETTLRQIAETTGGAYVPLGQRAEGLNEIYQRYIASLPKQSLEERREKIRLERFEWPLALAILLLMAEFMTNERASSAAPRDITSAGALRPPQRRRKRSVAVVTFLTGGLILSVFARASESDTAERAYKSGKYDDALQHYEKAAQGQPTRNDLDYNAGDAAYKAGDFTGAEEAYHRALETSDLSLQEQAYYNLGNAQYQHGQTMLKVDRKKTINLWRQALHSYDSAMKLKVSADAKHNYDVVKAKLDELKKQQKGKGKKSKGGPGGGDPDQSNDGDDGDDSSSGEDDQQNGDTENGHSHGGNQDEKPKPGDASGQQQDAANNGRQLRTYSGQRAKDQRDPQIRSRQDAENLLDSLKDDQKRVSARSLEGNNQPPPPASGKDW